ncbi:hypothetical protein BFW38_10690 [Terasakiispira papahanaumokuakeensis]|uniref:Uncharacterized protein n=1 Tax=Terasakiispira papahanaumokuakeensis TaxID=197479 RepID=A0A1E2VAS4_9GAMM|nr:DUF637 domain-containing protein [Terasakiispira papahanaumokuakeensis]ODC03936.1 hypothetical protein BFW38_10690 [Terasakiispira papahanaumokuakeensis]
MNREVETGRDTSGSLSNNLDEDEINAKFAIASTFVKETATYIKNRGKEVDRAKKALDTEKEKTADERDDALVAQLEQQYKTALIENETWLPGGTGRKVVNALNAAVGGNLSAGATQFVQMGVANYLQQEGASLLGEWTREGKLTEGSPLHAALHGAVGCLGAAAGGGDCGAGGMGAATSSLLTNLFTAQPDETVAEKETKRDIIVGLTTAMALGTNLDPGTAMNSAVSSVDNNYLISAQIAQKRKELEACQSSFCRFQVESKWTGVDIGQELSFDAGVVAGVPAGLHDTIDGVVKMLGNPGKTYEALRLLLNSDDLLGNVSDAVKQSFRDRLDKMDEEYLKGGAEGAFNSGMETGKLFMDIAGLLTGAGGAVKTTAMATEKVIARVVALKGAGRSVVGRGLDQAGDAAKAGDDLVELGRDTDLPEHRDSTAGRETGQDSHTHDDVATSTNDPRTSDNASSVGQNEASHHSGVDGSILHKFPLSQTQIDEIRSIPHGQRPDPSDYLSSSYINEHISQFDDGASRFMSQRNLEKYGIAQRDGTSFVMTKSEADKLLLSSNGNSRAMANALGLPEDFFDANTLVRVDIPKPRELNLRIPSGNEAGANDLWVPGGRLPDGALEAVIDAGDISPSQFRQTPLSF